MNKKIYYFLIAIIVLISINFLIFRYSFHNFKKEIKSINESNYKVFMDEKIVHFDTFKDSDFLENHFEYENAKMLKDTFYRVLLFNDKSIITSYDNKYYECLKEKQQNLILNQKTDSTVLFFKEKLIKKYGGNVTKLYNNIQNESFVIKDSINLYCTLYNNELVSKKINKKGIQEFDDFLKLYSREKKNIEKLNNKVRNHLNNRINKIKNKLTKDGKEILKQKVESNDFLIHSTENRKYQSEHLSIFQYKFDIIKFNDFNFNNALDEIYQKQYSNHSLNNGAKPYAYCYGASNSCSGYNCSQISVKTPLNSDVLVTIKKNDKVYRHAYVRAGRKYTFNLPDGNYQTFFYYGKGWNPYKVMTKTNCGKLKGGFTSNESFGKDRSQYLNGAILSYELILQQNGNFSTSPSSASEAF